MRFDTFCIQRSRLPKADYPDGREIDAYDGHSILFGDWKEYHGEVELVGTFRLTPCHLGYFLKDGIFGDQRFVLPEISGGEEVRLDTTAEASRLVAPSVQLDSGKRVLVSMLLFSALLRKSNELGLRHWVYAANPRQVDNMRHDGWKFERLINGTHEYYGEEAEAGILALRDYDFVCRRLAP
ncbi:MAG: GNAT family N-acyltransferase [Candidatus Uhrbacteria bacterium]|nr:GNAT family N-acyltransferase [Candidatus Uhrbacteria bacterium]